MLLTMVVLAENFSNSFDIDDELIIKISNGDMDAFHTLYEAVSKSVYGFALSITKNSHDAEDVMQDTFLTIHTYASSYKPIGKPMAWILTIAKNHSITKLRQNGKLSELSVDTHDDEAIERIKSIEDKMIIKAMLENLNEEEREIVMLHAVTGLKNREIAKLLDLPIGTVLSKYNRAIKKLQVLETEVNAQ